MTQCEMVLAHLKQFKQITDKEAYDRYAIRRLGGRIFDLRKRGENIRTVMTTKANRFGKYTTFATYIWEGENEDGEVSIL